MIEKSRKICGFSLIELSIVLVILGLLTGGILAGQSLIRAAELRAVGTEYTRYATAAQTFRDKYFALPGDFNGATRFWLRQVNATHCVTNSAAAVSTPGTCDGDGNGQVAYASGASQSQEIFQFWKQLALAGLIEGTYTGLATSTANTGTTVGENVPASRLGNACWAISYRAANTGDSNEFILPQWGNRFSVGGVGTNLCLGLAFTTTEAWNIDTKMDDGKPGTGSVVPFYFANCTPATANTQTTVDYDLARTGNVCNLAFTRMF